jgi:hypothetical protein
MDMFSTVQNWINNLPRDKKDRILEGLTKEGVRQGKHHDEEKRQMEQSMPGAHSHGPPQTQGGFNTGGGQGGGLTIGGINLSQGAQALGFQDPTGFFPGSREVQEPSYQQTTYQQTTYTEPRSSQGGYGRQTTERRSEQRVESYSQGQNESYYGAKSEEHSEYQKPSHQKKKHNKKHDEEEEEEQSGYGQRETYGTSSRQRDEDTSFGQRQTYGTSSRQRDSGSSRQPQEEESYGQRETYASQRTPSYAQREEREGLQPNCQN